MGPNERLFKKQYARELLAIARGDLESARELSVAKTGRKENVIFLAQQSVEKAIKSVLCSSSKPVPFSHDILILLTKLTPDEYPPGGTLLSDLTPYATIRRYEEGIYELSTDELNIAIGAAEAVFAWAQKKSDG